MTIATLIFILYIGRSTAFCTITNKNITAELSNCERPITQLKLQNSILIEIPSQILDAGRDISFIDISGVGLKSMESTSFCKFKKITSIDFSNNSLTTLPKQMLSECEPCLNDLNISFNKITELNNLIFIKLTSLATIDLSSNRIERLVDDVFKPLVNLITLRLNNNRISIIDDDLFRHNSNLLTLTLNNNMLATIENGSFHGLKELRAIELGNNPELRIINFSGMDRLQRVQIENCSLLVLHVPAHGKTIIARKNNISHIEIDQKNELESLDLSMNHIRNLSDLSLLIHLKFLDLSNNELVEINFSHLATLTNLTRLIIYNNPTKKLDRKALSLYLPSVREIGISADSFGCANQEECNEWMRSHNIRILFNDESASNITNPPKLKTTNIRSLPKPPLVYIQEQNISRLVEYLETKVKEMSDEISSLNVKFAFCVIFYFLTFLIIILTILFKPCCCDISNNIINWREEQSHEVLDNLIEAEESL